MTVSLSDFDLFSPVRVNVDIDKVTFVETDASSSPEKCEYTLGEVELLSSLPAECNPAAVLVAVMQALTILPSPLLPPHPPSVPVPVPPPCSANAAASTASTAPTSSSSLSSEMLLQTRTQTLTLTQTLATTPRRGKVEEFLLRFRHDHYLRVFGKKEQEQEQRKEE